MPRPRRVSARNHEAGDWFTASMTWRTGMTLKATTILAALLTCGGLAGGEFRLQLKTRTVYIVRMPNGLENHLASRITSAGVLWGVLDPEKADAVLTDRVDETFWAWSQTYFGPAKKVPQSADPPRPKLDTAQSAESRGTLFLVDPRTGLVLWAMYDPQQSTSRDALDQIADRVAKGLKKSLDPK